jgi:electron transport complex protein RnfG
VDEAEGLRGGLVTQPPFKNTPFNMVLVLSVTAITVGAILAGFFQLVSATIEENRREEERKAIFAVIEGIECDECYEVITKNIEVDGKVRPVRIFRGHDVEGNTVGYSFIAEGPGFAAKIKMMVGLNVVPEALSGLKVIEQIETPGLGDKIAKEKFQDQFRGLAIKPKIEYVKNRKPENENQIQAITGATISSKAVVDAINKYVVVVLKALEGEFKQALTESSKGG